MAKAVAGNDDKGNGNFGNDDKGNGNFDKDVGDGGWQLSRCVHQRTRVSKPTDHPCPNVTGFSHFSANVAIYINLQLFLCRRALPMKISLFFSAKFPQN